ncbi:glycoside hydrolase family 32 protein [Paenibacillus sp. GCM10023252]|uniref:glycoside hydrolase family 32 protein n=1 Tax=Paenibacillus sp. GCM10023252 TaxID=3252649 RepID=UPI00360FCC8A
MDNNKQRHDEAVAIANNAVFAAAAELQGQQDPYRPKYHFTAPANWINDPNGLIYYKGAYHLFYQHHPYSTKWGPMHWGHARSEDLIHWKHLPIALAPSEPYDEGGCFSGSAVEHEGMLKLIYTGHAPDRSPKQVQCVAMSQDGLHFDKAAANPVIAAPPAEGSQEFRDPKVWRSGDEWYMVVGTEKDGIGKVVLYRSTDLMEWSYKGTLLESDGSKGSMWECPDLFFLGEQALLVLSPMDMGDRKNCNIVIMGECRLEDASFTERGWMDLDYGTDYYAAQTLRAGDGRRIVIGWMDMWGASEPSARYGWTGCMALPRELTMLEDGILRIHPVAELQLLRGSSWQLSELQTTKDGLSLADSVHTQLCAEILIELDLEQTTAEQLGIGIRCSADGQEETLLTYNKSNGRLTLDRSRSGEGDTSSSSCLVPFDEVNKGILQLHVFLDSSSIEIFINDGRAVMTSRIYPKLESRGMRLFAVNHGTVVLKSLMGWHLEVEGKDRM